MQAYELLKKIYEDAHPFKQIEGLLEWDQRVMMPVGAIEERIAMQQALHHAIRAQREHEQIDKLVEEAMTGRDQLFGWDQRNLDLIAHIRRVQNALPPSLAVKLDHVEPHCRMLWPQAKQEKRWSLISAVFKELVELMRERAAIIADLLSCTPYEALLFSYTRGIKMKEIDALFAQLKPALQPLLTPQPHPKSLPVMLTREQQLQLSREMVQKIGFDFRYGRIDISEKAFHKATDNDSRITIGIFPDNFLNTVYGALHEAGHALHHRNRPRDWLAQPVGTPGDFCLRESMAFIWQYYACREQPFVDLLASEASKVSGQNVAAEQLIPMLNHSRPALLRNGHGDANYMMHIFLRYEMERDLINGALDPDDVPAVWNKKMRDDLGLEVPDDGLGCLQDIHWYKGSFGYFPCYGLAHLYAAQLFSKAKRDIPDFLDRYLEDQAAVMTDFLTWNVYSKANSKPGYQIIEEALGEALNPSYFIEHAHRLAAQGH